MIRYLPFIAVVTGAVACAITAIWFAPVAWALIILLPLTALGVYDLWQPAHSIRRIYPLVGQLRWAIEEIRPQIHQYLVEGELDGRPFSRDQRSVVYQRAKNASDVKPFGTELDVYGDQYEWINHSIRTKPVSHEPFRVDIGGPQCTKPYSASILNISAMSFGSLGEKAIAALNLGAKRGNFAHDTGEGSISQYHRLHGGDLIWEIGSGYFGCRNTDGSFSPDKFRENACQDQVKMIEIKLSQGAKPGHGGRAARRQGNRGNRRSPRRSDWANSRIPIIPQRVLNAFGTRQLHRRVAGTFRRQTGGVQALRRTSLGIPRHRQGDA